MQVIGRILILLFFQEAFFIFSQSEYLLLLLGFFFFTNIIKIETAEPVHEEIFIMKPYLHSTSYTFIPLCVIVLINNLNVWKTQTFSVKR